MSPAIAVDVTNLEKKRATWANLSFDSYSLRSADIGSTALAACAGRYAAKKVNAASSELAAM